MTGRKLLRAVLFRLQSEHVLAAAALFGLGLAALGAFTPRHGAHMTGTAALVNGVPILRSDHARVVEALAASKRNYIDAEDRAHALTRLIEEELLIQRSIELGLHRSDATTRKRLVASMLEWITADAAGDPPSDEALRAFFAENRILFTRSARIEVDWFHVARSEPDSEARAKRIAARLANGEPFGEVAKAASRSTLTVPNGLLPPAKLRDYLGPSLTQAALALKPGKTVGPMARPDGWHFLLVHRREDAAAPAFKTVRGQVEAEYLRRRADDAVRNYLDKLRRQADIVIAPDTDG